MGCIAKTLQAIHPYQENNTEPREYLQLRFMTMTERSEQVFGSFKDNREPALHMVAAVFLPFF